MILWKVISSFAPAELNGFLVLALGSSVGIRSLNLGLCVGGAKVLGKTSAKVAPIRSGAEVVPKEGLAVACIRDTAPGKTGPMVVGTKAGAKVGRGGGGGGGNSWSSSSSN